jgi:hypothetical protein
MGMLTAKHMDGFRKHVNPVPAQATKLAEPAYDVRPSLYCEDFGYEPMRPGGREFTYCDVQATSILACHVVTGEFVADARLIRVQPDAPNARLTLALASRDRLDWPLIASQPISRREIAQAPRLRKGDALKPPPLLAGHPGGGVSTAPPCILFGLYLGLVGDNQRMCLIPDLLMRRAL